MDTNFHDWPPAVGQDLNAQIDQTLRFLQILEKESPVSKLWLEYASLFKEILTLSKPDSNCSVVKLMLRGDVSTKMGIEIDKRYWERFMNWYKKYVLNELIKESKKTWHCVLYPIRVSDPRGGYHEKKEAIIFLTFYKTDQITIVEKSSQKINKSEFSSKNYAVLFNQIINKYYFILNKLTLKKKMDSWQFGVSMGFLSIFLFFICTFLPDDSRRNMFIVTATVIGVISCFFMERGGRVDRSFRK